MIKNLILINSYIIVYGIFYYENVMKNHSELITEGTETSDDEFPKDE